MITDAPLDAPTRPKRTPFIALLIALRPKQWTKNLILFAALLVTLDIHHAPSDFLSTALAFVVFCALSSSSYLLNDVLDRETDRRHPRKCSRPIAAGEISPTTAVVFSVILLVAGLIGAYLLGIHFACFAAIYAITTIAYTFRLKHIVLLDVLSLAFLYVLRAMGGACVINAPISAWLVLCTLMLALFLGISKRRAELVAVNQGRKVGRPILEEYSAAMLDQMNNIVTSALVMSYALYTIQSDAAKAHPYLIWTIPFVIYGIFRYLYLIHRHEQGEAPDEVLLKDMPLLICIALWAVALGAIVAHHWMHY